MIQYRDKKFKYVTIGIETIQKCKVIPYSGKTFNQCLEYNKIFSILQYSTLKKSALNFLDLHTRVYIYAYIHTHTLSGTKLYSTLKQWSQKFGDHNQTIPFNFKYQHQILQQLTKALYQEEKTVLLVQIGNSCNEVCIPRIQFISFCRENQYCN